MSSSEMVTRSTGAPGRGFRLSLIAVSVAVVSMVMWGAGQASDVSILSFAGLMVGASTFVPLPADTFVLAAAADHPAWTIGLVGGAVNTVMVLVERVWVRLLVDHPRFDRVSDFFATNRFVAWTERNMFVSLLVGGATLLPFEPFRLVAVLTDYSSVKYAAATFMARGGRYYVLAAAGSALAEVGWLRQAIWITLALFAFGLWRTGLRLARSMRE